MPVRANGDRQQLEPDRSRGAGLDLRSLQPQRFIHTGPYEGFPLTNKSLPLQYSTAKLPSRSIQQFPNSYAHLMPSLASHG